MIEQPSRTLVCSIVFLDIVEYSTKPVAEQMLLKQAFNKLLSAALENVHARDRIVLDTGDGAAITFLGDPEDALFVAMSLRAAARAEATARSPSASASTSARCAWSRTSTARSTSSATASTSRSA